VLLRLGDDGGADLRGHEILGKGGTDADDQQDHHLGEPGHDALLLNGSTTIPAPANGTHGAFTRPAPQVAEGNADYVCEPSRSRHVLAVPSWCSGGSTNMPSTPRRHRILIVDDDPVVRLMLQRSLELAHFDVVVACNGAEGLRILRDDDTIGLVLLDLRMPGMDGWAFLQEQRADSRLATIPTIILSGSTLAKNLHEELQAADFLQKPIGRHRLISVVASYCQRRQD
jgi:CheY-like chemotaxis protein